MAASTPKLTVVRYKGLITIITQHNVRGTCIAGNRGAHNRVGNINLGQARQIKFYNYNGIGHIARNYTQPKRPQNSEYFKANMLLMQAQENGVALDEEQLLFIAADDCNAFTSDVDEAPTTQTMLIVNLSLAYPVYDEASPSYASDILFEAQIKENHKSNCVTMLAVKSKVLAPGMYVIDVEPIPLCNRNNREVHIDYLKHLKESVATLREIIEDARVEKPLDSLLASAFLYTKHLRVGRICN
nr:hypothetical protein [Tanacetum cinerariifolium]